MGAASNSAQVVRTAVSSSSARVVRAAVSSSSAPVMLQDGSQGRRAQFGPMPRARVGRGRLGKAPMPRVSTAE
jgi:hypothetical protein